MMTRPLFRIIALAVIGCLLCHCGSKENFTPNPEYNYLPVKINGKWGFINHDGDYLIYPKFSNVMPFSEGMAAVCENDKWGFIDTLGRMVIESQYSEVTLFSEEKAFALNTQGTFVCIDKQNRVLFTLHDIEACSIFRGGVAQVTLNGKVHYVDSTGETCSAPGSYDIPLFDPMEGNGPIPTADKNGLYGYTDSSGHFVIAAAYEGAAGFRNHLAAITQNELIGFVNRQGKLIIEPRYEASYPQCRATTSLMKDTLHLKDFVNRFLQGTSVNRFKSFSMSKTLQDLLSNGEYTVEAQALIRPSKTRLTPFVTLLETSYGFDEPIMKINKNLTFNYQDGFNHADDSLQIEYTEEELDLRNMTFTFELAEGYLSIAPRLLKELRDQLANIMQTTYHRSNDDYILDNKKMRVVLVAPVSQSDNRFSIEVTFNY